MAESKNNIVTHGLSGKVGDILVFSQRNGKTIVSKAPKERTGEASDKQKQQIAKFQQAVIYAKSVLQDPITKAIYTDAATPEKGVSTYNVAVADLLNAPKIEEIDLSNYNGDINDTISVTVTDDFQVASVKVIINNADGSLVEQGNATLQGSKWVFVATVNNSDLAGDKITIQATDIPDNLSEKTETI
ncbi:hypothetical protein EG240_16070 [Paenimyroides tangerinum]|uniref:Bacterial Ig-like domain-containing protein n=1 Tax=Paenimyroides tangerinum TaxID=2488728 RepID=A0A3P3VWT6_9FLAO|nr:hypothetical protein [Paenimyroides tangerinum]RRJ86498.1 hypothetical protein EG240_16070 [Paenimyroides tangerinum]